MPDERQKNGGSRPGAGRPRKALRASLQELFDEALDDDEMQEILRVMSARARSGDERAAVFIFDRCFGKPVAEDAAAAIEEAQAFIDEVLSIVGEMETNARETFLQRLSARGLPHSVPDPSLRGEPAGQ